MPTVAERVSVVEVQVANLDEKLDEVKIDVKDMHFEIKGQLQAMYDASCTQHAELGKKLSDNKIELTNKISELEKIKDKWMYMIIGGIAVGAFVLGHFSSFSKIFG